MPQVLLEIDARDSASAAMQKVSTSLNLMDRALQNMGGHSATLAKFPALLGDIASAAGKARMEVDALALSFDRINTIMGASITSNQRFVGAMADGNQLIRTRAMELKSAADAQERLNTTMRGQPNVSGGGVGSGGGSGGGGYGVTRSLLQGAGYALAYGTYSAASQSLGRDTAYSRLLGSTAAMTGLSPAQAAQLSTLIRGQAGSGTQPYDASTLLQGSYSIASLGIGNNDPRKIAQVTQTIAHLSAAGGATDTSVAGDAITSLIAAYGLNNRNVVGNTQTLANQLQVGVKLGKVDLPTFATQASGPLALTAKQLGVSTADVIAGIAAESVGGVSPGTQGLDFAAMLRSSARPTMPQRQEAAALGIKYDSSFWGRNGVSGGSAIIEQAMQRQGITGAMQEPVLGKLFGLQDAATGFMAMRAGNIAGFAPQVADSKNASEDAYHKSQSYAGNQLADAEAKLSTAFDNLTTAALPGLTKALKGAADGLDAFASVLNGPGGKGGFGASVKGAGLTLGHFLDPSDPAFMSMDKARQEAGITMQGAAMGQLVHGVRPGTAAYSKLPAWAQMHTGADGGYNAGTISLPDPYATTAAPGSPAARAARQAAVALGGGLGNLLSASRDSALGGYSGATGVNSPAYQTAIVTGRGGAGQLPELVNALQSLKNTISANMGKNAVESMLGSYRAVVNAQPDSLLSPAKKSGDIFAAEMLVARYEAALAAASTKATTTAAKDTYGDTTRALKDLQNQASIDKLQGNQGAYGRDQRAVLAYQTANAGVLKLDKSDLSLLAASMKADLQAANPRQNSNPFFQQNSGLGGLIAGPGSTVLRLGGGTDPQTAEIRELKKELSQADARIIALLQQIAEQGSRFQLATNRNNVSQFAGHHS